METKEKPAKLVYPEFWDDDKFIGIHFDDIDITAYLDFYADCHHALITPDNTHIIINNPSTDNQDIIEIERIKKRQKNIIELELNMKKDGVYLLLKVFRPKHGGIVNHV